MNDAIATVDHDEPARCYRKVYQSICNPSSIPDVARDVTWYDPFYENDSNIIAAFDIDQKKIKEYMEKSKLYYVGVIPLGMFTYFLFGNWFIVIVLGIQYLVYINNYRQLHSHYRNTHIAISRDGIYLDECDNTNQTLMLRTIIKYENIHNISIESYTFGNHFRYYVVSIKNSKGQVTHVLSGFFAVQKFVDIVNAMIELYRLSLDDNTTTTTTSMDMQSTNDIEHPSHDIPVQAVTFDEP
jgi:hypothetical protein